MNGRYERLILDLEPWLRRELRKKKVPGAYRLKALGDEGEDEGQAADVRAEVMKKALSVLRDMERGRQRRLPPEELAPYIKVVMRNAIRDWKRSHPKAASLSPDERAQINKEFFPIGKDEGDEGFSAMPTIHAPPGPREPAQPPRPFLLTLVRFPFWWKPDVGAEYERVQERLNAIPDEHRREAVFLDLQGYRQGQIAAKVFRTQQAVSKALREQYATWGWDDEKVQVIRWLMAYANLVRLFGRLFPDADLVFPEPRRQDFWPESLDFKEQKYESKEEWQAALRRREEFYRVHERSFELPREEEAYNRSRQPVLPEDLDLPIEGEREQWWKSGPQQESKERGQRKLNRLKAQDARVYRAIMNEPTLARWTKDLKQYHMAQLTARLMGGDYGWLHEDD